LPAAKQFPRRAGKYKEIAISVVDKDGKEVKYTGVPLRVVLAEMMPDVKLENMPNGKSIAPELVMVAVVMMVIRFGHDHRTGHKTRMAIASCWLLTRTQALESGVQLICKAMSRTRW